MVEIQGPTFGYTAAPVLTDLRLAVRPGTICGLLGANGAGKSTLLNLIAGLLFTRSGSVRALGRDPAAREPAFLADVFVLPEAVHVPQVSGAAYAAARAPFYPRFDAELFARYQRELEIPPTAKLSSLSYGQQKKFLLAFGLATRARLVLLDEPTNGLDIPSKAVFRRVLAEALADDRAFVISTHQVRDLGALLDPIVILHQGRVLLDRTVAEIGARTRMMHSAAPPPTGAEGLLYAEPTVGGYWSLWQSADGGDGPLDLEVLFNAVVARPAIVALFERAGGVA
jgi:ABC-2 type transport system ATP-binding protein